MDNINNCILKKQIYCEFHKLFSENYSTANKQSIMEYTLFLENFRTTTRELIMEYITSLINFYESSNSYVESVNLLKEMQKECNFRLDVIGLKRIIAQINDTDVLLMLLSFFVGKNVSRQFIYTNC